MVVLAFDLVALAGAFFATAFAVTGFLVAAFLTIGAMAAVFLVAGALAGAFFAAAFFTGALAVTFLATAFFAGALAGTFLAAAFFAGALEATFLAAAFAAGFLATAFLAGAFLAGAFLATGALAVPLPVGFLEDVVLAAVFFGAALVLALDFLVAMADYLITELIMEAVKTPQKRTARRRLVQHAPATGTGSYQISRVVATEFAFNSHATIKSFPRINCVYMTWHWGFDNLEQGILQRRYKRFLADVKLQNGEIVVAHCPNTGAMKGCQQTGSRVWLSPSDNPKRKLAWTLELVEDQGSLVCVHSVLANRVVEGALKDGIFPELSGFDTLHREVNLGANTRVDFRLAVGAASIWVEVKAVSWCVGAGLGQFPDAVSVRARKHVQELASLVSSGTRAALIFCAFHQGIERIVPALEVDPKYAEALVGAVQAGVEIYGLGVEISPRGLKATKPLDMGDLKLGVKQ